MAFGSAPCGTMSVAELSRALRTSPRAWRQWPQSAAAFLKANPQQAFCPRLCSWKLSRTRLSRLNPICLCKLLLAGARVVTVWSDGACLFPKDPFLVRAGWGFRADTAEPRAMHGRVQSVQTAQRPEVTAVLADSRFLGCRIDLATDSKYVVKTFAAIADGALAGNKKHVDLWRQVPPHIRSSRIAARWVPAHLASTAARDRCISERDRLGNAAADSAAGAAVEQALAPRALVAQRQQQLAVLEATQRILGVVQLAVLQACKRGEEATAPTKRCWGKVRRGARRVRSAPPATASHSVARGRGTCGQRPCQQALSCPPTAGARLRVLFAGAAWQPHSAACGPGFVQRMRGGVRSPALEM